MPNRDRRRPVADRGGDLEAEARTRESFGFLWDRVEAGDVTRYYESHVERLARALPVRVDSGGVVLDAGCGDGDDVSALARLAPRAAIVGMDFSGGVAIARDRTRKAPNAFVAKGSVLHPPFRPGSISLVYSYGVIHHTPDPARGFASLAELVRPGGQILIYVYTDLREEPLLRAGIVVVGFIRRFTTRLRPATLFAICRLMAPIVYLLFGLPARLLRRVPGGRAARLAGRLPFNLVSGPLDGTGDLFDRFSAPIEHRHSRAEILGWYRAAGLVGVSVVGLPDARGWVAIGQRPGPVG
ncbi:MAG: class I SAM-dependent methyltransferase [Acidimicrobiales bacterium]